MIREVSTKKGADAITSDRWHVVHARFTGAQRDLPFARGIISEHDDRATCAKVAKALRARLALEGGDLPAEERDEVFVRRPNFRSLKLALRSTATV